MKCSTKKFTLFLLWIIAVIFCGGSRASLQASTLVVQGTHRIVYDVVNPLGVRSLPNYTNNGYTQNVLDRDEFSTRLLVEVDLKPLNSSTPFPMPDGILAPRMSKYLELEDKIQIDDPGIQILARELSEGCSRIHEVHSRILDWVYQNITYDSGKQTRQDARSVVQTRRGNCVGYTRLIIALCRSLGIPARYVHGYLPTGYDWGVSREYCGVKILSGGFHAWVEVYYPDIGWTFSDGEHSKNFADPYHILTRIDGIDINPGYYQGGELSVDKATTYTIAEEENTTVVIDYLPEPEKKILARRRYPQQYGTVWGEVSNSLGQLVSEGVVYLWKGNKGIPFPFDRGRYSVVGLESGAYKITFRIKGSNRSEERIEAIRPKIIRHDVKLPQEAHQPGFSEKN